MNSYSDELIKATIKGRQVVYYLTTEEDLNNIKSNSLIGDVFFCLTSVAIGGIISVKLTEATGIELKQETINLLIILLYVFIWSAIVSGILSSFFHFKAFSIIKNIKGSGSVKSLNKVDEEETAKSLDTEKASTQVEPGLEIISASYWTRKRSLDVTDELREMITNDQLEFIATNDIKGDPDPRTVKRLSIKYKFKGVEVAKEFKEGDRVIIP
jgi:hypothetical protein